MKAKQLILELKKLVKDYGNQEVTLSYPACLMTPTRIVKPYDEQGNGPQDEEFKGAKRFHIH